MTDISSALNRVNGKLRSLYPPINPDNSWRIDNAFRVFKSFPIELIHPLQNEAGPYAAFRWSDSNMPHKVKISWFGGEAPYRVTLVSAPSGASIGGVQTQTFTKTQIGATNKYEFSMPENFAVFECPTSGLTQGTTYSVTVLVEDMNGAVLVPFTFTHDDTKSVWFSGAGSDANAGTFSSPKQTFGHGYGIANAHTKIYRYKSGTYLINNGAALNDAQFNSTHCNSHIAYESGVIFDYSTGHMTGGGDDITLIGYQTIGGRPDYGSVKQVNFDQRVRRVTVHDVAPFTNVVGSTGGDNPSAFFFPNIDPNYHENISFSDCAMVAGSKSQLFSMFSVRRFSAINCHAENMDTTSHNGAHAFHLKHAFQKASIQFCSASGRTDTGLLWVSSQEPTLCSDIDISNCRLDYSVTNIGYNAMRLNGQVGGGQPNASELYVQRCSFISPASSISADQNGLAVNPAKISACAWQSSGSTFILGAGYIEVGTPSDKVSDVDDLAIDKAGTIGHKIISTLVS